MQQIYPMRPTAVKDLTKTPRIMFAFICLRYRNISISLLWPMAAINKLFVLKYTYSKS